MSDRTRWYSARKVRPSLSGVYEFGSVASPDLTALDYDEAQGWGRFITIGPSIVFQKYTPTFFDRWRGAVPATAEGTSMQTQTQVTEQWLPLTQASADLAEGWYRIEPSDRFGPYARHVQGYWLVMLKTGEQVELPASALDKFQFDASAAPRQLSLPRVDRLRDPRELTGARR